MTPVIGISPRSPARRRLHIYRGHRAINQDKRISPSLLMIVDRTINSWPSDPFGKYVPFPWLTFAALHLGAIFQLVRNV